MINFLRAYGWALFLGISAVVFGYGLGATVTEGRLGRKVTQAEKNLVTASLAFSEARRLAAEKYSDDLKAEQQRYRELSDFSEQLLDEYHQTSDELDALKQQHERSVSYAVTHDGQAFTGLGPDGLRLYRAALGYSAKEGGKILPSDTGGTVASSTETRAADVGRAEGATHSRDGVRNVGAEAGAAIDAYRPMEPEARGAP
ncbi:Uncharacterised protein [Leminorella richardii]|uniref:Uncharacterized protein n=1 Tax=Leminorella richardii TaxID=158841 RepID=A0A2X4UH94_9GAMM|nr:hypothetical protein [Leminorella richardii]SQI34958.1 Uncharacterised protein [Leminorella richardii]